MAKVCFITAIYGNYEKTCKKFAKQTIETDFICFTNNENIISNGWFIDSTPYHNIYKSPLDNDTYLNSLCNNDHTFNIAKYYKQAFRNIPILNKYDVIIWIDGSIEIIYDKVSEYILRNIYDKQIITWKHDLHKLLSDEARASHFERYTSTYWLGQKQPYQDIDFQYQEYLKEGYTDEYFKNINHPFHNLGVWITCFVAFDIRNDKVKNFLDLWYLQTLKYSTQDQIGFPFTCQKLNIIPYTLPDNEITGHTVQSKTMFYIKRNHGE